MSALLECKLVWYGSVGVSKEGITVVVEYIISPIYAGRLADEKFIILCCS